MAFTATCYSCRQSFARDSLVSQSVFKGHNGRRKNGRVLMCGSCSAVQKDNNVLVAIFSLIGMAVLTVIVLAVRGH